MTKTFASSTCIADRSLIAFTGSDNAALLRAICTNSTTGYVRQLKQGGAIMVPSHAATKVAEHLVKRGWTLEG